MQKSGLLLLLQQPHLKRLVFYNHIWTLRYLKHRAQPLVWVRVWLWSLQN